MSVHHSTRRTAVRTVLAVSIASLLSLPAMADDVYMTGNDPAGTASFDTASKWSDGSAPMAGNDYYTTFQLRTPTGTGAFSFNGTSLTLQTVGSLLFKGSGVMTINDLRLDGGSLFQGQTGATPDDAKLAGNIRVLSASTIDTTPNSGRIFTITSKVQGTGDLNLIGTSGTIRFNNTTNDWTGVALLGNGANTVLEIASIANGGLASGLGASSSSASNIILNTGTLRVTGTVGGTTDRLFTLAGNGGIESSATGTPAVVNFTNTGDIVFSGTGARTFTLGGSNTGDNTFAPRIVDNPNGGVTSFTKSGNGTWTLKSQNTYSGATNINGGVLVFNNIGELGTGTGMNFGGGTLRWGAGNTFDITSRTITATANTSSFDTNGQDITLAGTLTGTGIFRKTGAGRLTLTGNNSFTGGFVVNNGSVLVTNNNSLGTGAGQITIDGNTGASGVLELSGDVSIAKPVLVNARQQGTIDAPHIKNVSGNNTLAGQINLTTGGSDYNFESANGFLLLSGGINASTLTSGLRRIKFGGDGNGQVNGIIGNPGLIDLPLVKYGGGTWVIAGPSSYSGTTTVNAGTLITNTAATGSGAVTVADGAGFGVRVIQSGQSYNTPSLTIGSAAGGKLTFDLGAVGNPTAPVIATTSFAPSGTIDIAISGSNLAKGQFKLVDYVNLNGAGFDSLKLTSLPPRVTATLVNNIVDTSVDLDITGFDFPKWTGATNNNWDINNGTGTGTANWKEVTSENTTTFLQGSAGTDSALFDDSATNSTVNLTTTLTPTSVLVSNTNRTYTFTGSGKLSGSTGITKEGTGTAIIANTGGNDFTGNAVVKAGTLQIGDGVTAGAGTLGTVTVNISAGATVALNRPDDFTFANVVTGSGTLNKIGTGTATLTANNTGFTGTLKATGGTVKLGSANALGSTAGTALFSEGGTLDVNGLIVPSGKIITASGAGVSGNGAIVNSVANATTPGLKNLTLAGDTTIGGTQRWDIRDSAGGLNGAGFTLTKKGTNEIWFKDLTETNLGSVNIESGVLGFEGSTTLGTNPGTISVRSGAQLSLFNSSVAHTKSVLLDGGILAGRAGTANNLSGTVTLAGSASVDINSGVTLTLAGLIDGTGSLTKSNAGTLVLSGNSSFTGGLNVTAGIVNLIGANNYAGGTTIATGTTVNVGAAGVSGSLGSGAVVNSGTLNINRTDTALILANEISGDGAINFGAGNAANFNSIVTLSGNNTFTANVNVVGGGIRITNSNALGIGPKSVNLTNGTAGRPNLRLAAGSESIILPSTISFNTSNINDDGTIVNESGSNIIHGNFTLTAGGGDTALNVLGGTLTTTGTFTPNTTNRRLVLRGTGAGFFNGSLVDGGGNIPGLVKEGTGSWTLGGDNSYTGDTNVNAGTLLVNGSISGSVVNVNSGTLLVNGNFSGPSVNVNAGGILGGTGQLSSTYVSLAPGGHLAPGNGAGTLTLDLIFGTLDLSLAVESIGSGTLAFELGAINSSDKITILSGDLTIGTGVLDFDDFSFTSLAGFGAGTYTLIDGNNPIFGTLGTNLTGTINGLSAQLGFADSGKDLVLTVVPEPSSAVLVASSFGTLFGFRRFRRGKRCY